MALQIWLPLNGDLKNQGLSNLSIINNGATVNNNGKIGKCYNLVSGNYLGFDASNVNNHKYSPISIAIWIYPTQEGSTTQHILGCWENGGVGISISSDKKIGFSVYVDNNYESCIAPSVITFNTWHHICATYDETMMRLYIDGIEVATNPVTGKIIYHNTCPWQISGNPGATAYGSGNFIGRVNDVRIYDHCLSPKEVKEISKGLVLHYPLRGSYIKNLNPYVLSSENYTISDYADRTTSSIINGVYHVNGYLSTSSVDTLFSATTKNFITLLANTDYYLSFYCKVQSANTLSFGTSGLAYTGLISNSGRHYPSNYVNLGTSFDGFVILKIRTSSDTLYKINLGFDTPNIFGVGSFIEFHSVMLSLLLPSDYVPYEYNNNIIYDSSGYNNNGTVTGTLTNVTDSARYDKSTYISEGVSNYIVSPTINIPGDAITTNIWIKSSNTSATGSYHMPFESESSGYMEMSISSGVALRGGLYINGTRYVQNVSGNVLDGKWHMITITYDGATIKRYVDGVLGNSTSVSGTLNAIAQKYYFGKYGTNNSYASKEMYISDARLYSTALSEDDIKDLYQEAAFIDYKGNIGCYLFYEDSENSKELWPTPTSGVTYNDDGSYTITGYKSAYSTYIPIDSSKTFYYDIEYSNLNAGNYFLIGFERYDIDKLTGINQGCLYITTTKNAELHTRKVGTIAFSEVNGNPAAFTRLRILNHWSGSTSDSPSDSEAIIHYISLKEVSTPTLNQINKQGLIKSDLFIEAESATVSKYGNITANQLIEI